MRRFEEEEDAIATAERWRHLTRMIAWGVILPVVVGVVLSMAVTRTTELFVSPHVSRGAEVAVWWSISAVLTMAMSFLWCIHGPDLMILPEARPVHMRGRPGQ